MSGLFCLTVFVRFIHTVICHVAFLPSLLSSIPAYDCRTISLHSTAGGHWAVSHCRMSKEDCYENSVTCVCADTCIPFWRVHIYEWGCCVIGLVFRVNRCCQRTCRRGCTSSDLHQQCLREPAGAHPHQQLLHFSFIWATPVGVWWHPFMLQLAFPWWLMMWGTFSNVSWPRWHPLLWNACSDLLPMF